MWGMFISTGTLFLPNTGRGGYVSRRIWWIWTNECEGGWWVGEGGQWSVLIGDDLGKSRRVSPSSCGGGYQVWGGWLLGLEGARVVGVQRAQLCVCSEWLRGVLMRDLWNVCFLNRYILDKCVFINGAKWYQRQVRLRVKSPVIQPKE